MNDKLLVNDQIRFSRVMVIDHEGRKLGEFLKQDAISLAETEGLDLVLVDDNPEKPICKLMDFDKFVYHQKKKEKENKSSSAAVKMKEIEFKLQTDQGYIDIKTKQAQKFLANGNKVKFGTTLKGREAAHANIVFDRCMSIYESLIDYCDIEFGPKMMGKEMSMILTPKSIKKD